MNVLIGENWLNKKPQYIVNFPPTEVGLEQQVRPTLIRDLCTDCQKLHVMTTLLVFLKLCINFFGTDIFYQRLANEMPIIGISGITYFLIDI